MSEFSMILYAAKISIYLCGLFNAVFALFHLIKSPFIFGPGEGNAVAPGENALTRTLNLSVAYFLFALAWLYISNPIQIITTSLGKNALIAGMALWIIRLALLLLRDERPLRQKFLFVMFLAFGVIAHYYPLTMR